MPTIGKSDIVDRLRQYGTTDRPESGTENYSLLYEAADEIEALRHDLERQMSIAFEAVNELWHAGLLGADERYVKVSGE